MSIVVSKTNKSLVIPSTNGTLGLFPNAKSLGDRLVVPHGLREYLLLKHLGYNLPHPMLTYYDWRKGKPFDVQRKTCAMLTANPRSYVLNHMGTGKTKSALWAWDYLRGNNYAKKALVVAPLSTLNFVWGREIFATLPNVKYAILHGSKKQRLNRLADPDVDVFIINHDGLKVIEDDLHARTDIDTLIIDELAVYRNNSDRSKGMRKFAERFDWVWGMTGAPMPNQPTDVWAQARIVTPNTVPTYFKNARDMLMTKVDQFKYIPKPDAVEKAFAMMQPAVRFELDDVVELPDVVSRTIDVDLTKAQADAYAKMSKLFQVMIDNETITAVNAGAAMQKLLQVSTGCVYTHTPTYVVLDSAPRQQTLLDLIDSAANKVLVFVPYRHALAELSKLLDAAKIEHAVVHGEVHDRDKIFNAFQNTTKYKVLLAHPQCLAHGLTLTVADTIVWYSPTASLEIYEQANARIRRVGQKNRQQILHLQSTPVEKKIYALLRSKQKIQNRLLELFQDATAGVRS
jgi:SNF2 family DNA or RNA helicase